jgi:hypothetical protein
LSRRDVLVVAAAGAGVMGRPFVAAEAAPTLASDPGHEAAAALERFAEGRPVSHVANVVLGPVLISGRAYYKRGVLSLPRLVRNAGNHDRVPGRPRSR